MKSAHCHLQKIMEKYGEKDEAGKLKFEKNGEVILKAGDEENYKKEFQEFLATKFQINRPKIKLAEISSAQLAPRDMEALASMIEEK